MLKFDGLASRQVEAVYSTPDVVEQRAAVRRALTLELPFGEGEFDAALFLARVR